MALKFTPKTEKIPFSDGDYIEVRGLDVPDLMQLFEVHQETVSGIYDKFTGRDPQSFTVDDAGDLASTLAMAFPQIVNHVIAVAADAADQFDLVSRLPLDVKAAALEKVAHLTFAMQGGPKKFLETAVRMAEGVGGLNAELRNLPLLSKTGFGDSASK